MGAGLTGDKGSQDLDSRKGREGRGSFGRTARIVLIDIVATDTQCVLPSVVGKRCLERRYFRNFEDISLMG